MNFLSDRLKNLFIPVAILSLPFIFLYSDPIVGFLVARFHMVNIVEVHGLFILLFFIIFCIYILIPFLKILFNGYGSIIQRILLTLSLASFLDIFIFSVFGTVYLFNGFGASYIVSGFGASYILNILSGFGTYSILSVGSSNILSGFGIFAAVYILFLSVFLNFTSKVFKSNSSSYIVSSSSLNILLMVYVSIFLLLFSYYIDSYWIPMFFTFLFVISSIFYLEKTL